MSAGRAGDSDLTYYVVDEVTGSGNAFEIFGKYTANPAYGYTTSNKTAGRKGYLEGSHPSEQLNVETKVDRKDANALPVKNGVVSAANLIVLVVAVVILIAAGVAITIAFIEISKLRSEVAELQALENTISIQQNINTQLSSELNNNSGIISNFATILDEEHVFSSCAAIQKFFPF